MSVAEAAEEDPRDPKSRKAGLHCGVSPESRLQ